MRPSDMDAIARVVAQQVKEIVDKKVAGLQPPEPAPDHSEQIAALLKTVQEQAEQIVQLNKSIENMLDGAIKIESTMGNIGADVETVKTILRHPKKTREGSVIDHLNQALEKCVKTDEFTEMADQMGNIEKVLAAHDEALEDRKDADPDLIQGKVLDTVMSKLPDLIKHQIPELPKALAPTDLQVIEAVKAVYPSIRHDLLNRIPVPTHKGLWLAETQYDVGDEVTKNGSTFRLMEPSSDAPPSPAWQLISQGTRGKQGKPGVDAKGEKGDAGVGVKEMIIEDGQFVVELTNGDTAVLDLELDDKIAKAVEKFMFDVEGKNDGA